jgi:hypothetical protein
MLYGIGRYELEKLYDFEEECLENHTRLLTEEEQQKTGRTFFVP